MTTNEFSKLIKERRTQLHLTQKELADQLHVSNKTISRWETGSGYPDIETIPQLAKILELDYEELLDGNTYIAKKEKQKKRRYQLVIGVLCLLCFLIGILYYRDSRGFQSKYTNKDLLVSGDMVNKVSLDYQAPTKPVGKGDNAISLAYLNLYDTHKHTQLLKSIKVDQLIKIAQKELTSPSDLKWLATMHFRYQNEALLKIHVYQDDKKTYFLFNQNGNYMDISTGDLYYYDGLLEIGLQIFADDLSHYNFEHSIENKSEVLKDVDEDKKMTLLKKQLAHPNFQFEENTLILKDPQENKQYLILIGQALDYTEINTEFEEGNLAIKIRGNDVLLANKYIHVFEITQQAESISITINDESAIISNNEIYPE